MHYLKLGSPPVSSVGVEDVLIRHSLNLTLLPLVALLCRNSIHQQANRPTRNRSNHTHEGRQEVPYYDQRISNPERKHKFHKLRSLIQVILTLDPIFFLSDQFMGMRDPGGVKGDGGSRRWRRGQCESEDGGQGGVGGVEGNVDDAEGLVDSDVEDEVLFVECCV